MNERPQHIEEYIGQKAAVYNPQNLPVYDLPIILGFNNGGSPGWYIAQLVCEDGTGIGSHVCSDEYFMYGDLGILDGSRPDRHETFRDHYPDGYRMLFMTLEQARTSEFLNLLCERNQALAAAYEASKADPAPVESVQARVSPEQQSGYQIKDSGND